MSSMLDEIAKAVFKPSSWSRKSEVVVSPTLANAKCYDKWHKAERAFSPIFEFSKGMASMLT